MLRNYNPILRVDVVERLSLVDYGDVPTVPGSTVDSIERASAALEEVAARRDDALSRRRPHGPARGAARAGGRARSARPVQLDAHHDVWDEYFGQRLFHGSVVRRAVEEGLVDPARSVQAGLRGSLNEAARRRAAARLRAWTRITFEELAALGPAGFSERVRERVGDAPCFLSFDIDFVDPAFAPGTGTPEVGGPSSREALTYVRSLAGLDFRGFDCVEVSAAVRSGGRDGVRRGERVLRDAVPARA